MIRVDKECFAESEAELIKSQLTICHLYRSSTTGLLKYMVIDTMSHEKVLQRKNPYSDFFASIHPDALPDVECVMDYVTLCSRSWTINHLLVSVTFAGTYGNILLRKFCEKKYFSYL